MICAYGLLGTACSRAGVSRGDERHATGHGVAWTGVGPVPAPAPSRDIDSTHPSPPAVQTSTSSQNYRVLVARCRIGRIFSRVSTLHVDPECVCRSRWSDWVVTRLCGCAPTRSGAFLGLSNDIKCIGLVRRGSILFAFSYPGWTCPIMVKE